jgi:hypothetical protein
MAAAVRGNYDAWAAQEQAQAKMMGTLRATGNTIGITTKELADLAGALQSTTVYGDEMVMNAEAILLTFRNVNKDIFPDTIKLAADMAATFGGDLSSATMQLGKALQEPISGVSALARVGVTFSAQQKEQIKGYVETNQLAKAQAIILGELKGQVGGVAAEMAATGTGTFSRLKNEIGDLQEVLGENMVKALQPAADAITDFVNKNKGRFAAIVANFPEIAKAVFNEAFWIFKNALRPEVMGKVFSALGEFALNVFRALWDTVPRLAVARIKLILEPFRALGEFLSSVFVNAWDQFLNYGAGAINKALRFVGLDKVFGTMEERAVRPIQNIGDAWEKYVNNQIANGTEFVVSYGDLLKGLGTSALDLGKDLAGVVRPETVAKLKELTEPLAAVYVDVPQRIKAVTDATDTLAASTANLWQVWDEGANTILVPSMDKNEDAIKRMEEQVLASYEVMAPVFSSLGQAIAEGGDGWDAFAEAAKDAVATALQALAKMWATQAAAMLVPGFTFNPVGAAGLFGMSAAALIASGVVKSLAHGGEFTTNGPEMIRVGDNTSGRERVRVTPLDQDDDTPIHLVINLDGRPIADFVTRASRRRQILIDGGSVI